MAAYDNPGLQQGNEPSHIESAQGDVFVLGSTLLADNPQLLSTYFKQAGYPMTTLAKLSSFGFGRLNKRGVEGPVTGHYEKPRPNELFTVGSIISSTGNEIVIELSEDDMVTETTPFQTTVFSRPRVTEVWQFVAGGNQYRITAKDHTVNPHQITLLADNTSVDPEDEIVEGSKAFFIAPVKGEGTDQVEPLRVRQYKYQNTFAILDETDITSGSHMTTAVRFNPVPGSNLLWLEGIEDMEMRHEEAKGKLWMFGKQATAWTDYSSSLKSNVPVTSTQGLLPYAQENGFDFQYDPDDFTEADIRALSAYYHDIRVGASEILLMQGYGINQKIEEFYAGKYNYNWVVGVSDRYMGEKVRNMRNSNKDGLFDPQGLMINLGVQGFTIGNYTFMQTAAPEFNYAQGAGAVGYTDWMIAAPFGRTNEDNDKVPYLGYEYRGTDGYSRENEVWCETGAGSRAIVKKGDFYKTSENDSHRTYLRSEIAPHFALGEQFAVFHPQSVSSS